MKMKVVIFAGIMNALVFAVIGLGINHISQRDARRSVAIIGGGILGFLIGSGYQIVLECKRENETHTQE